MPGFAETLTAARERANLTQAQLAARINVSPATVASWETGRRTPAGSARQQIIEAADILGIDASTLNEVLASLAMSPVPAGRLLPLLDRRRPLAVVQDECQTYPWPTLAMNEDFEVVAWNDAANDLSELDFGRDLAEPGERHLLRMALSDHYNRKLINWEDVIAVMVAMWKTTGFDPLAPTKTPYFDNLMTHVLTHHGDQLGKLLHLWQDTPPHVEGSRAVFEARWLTSDNVLLHFHNQLTAWSDFDAIAAFDWHPADAATWEWLDSRRQRRSGRAGRAAEPAEARGPTSARGLLRFARERNGLPRRALAARAGISESLLYGIESGKRAMLRETIVALGRAMTLDVASLNAILEASGFAPEPSDHTAYMLGYELSSGSRFAGNLERRTSWTPAAVMRELERCAWLVLVVNERCELIALNAPAAGVFGFDLQTLPPGPARNLFSLVSDAAFRTRAANWETVVANVLPGDLEAYMAPPGGHAPRGKDAAHFDAVVQFVREREAAAGRGDAVIHRLFAAWRAKANRRLASRTVFVLEWASRQPPLTFNTVITPWNSMFDPYWAIELHPGDAHTWRELSS